MKKLIYANTALCASIIAISCSGYFESITKLLNLSISNILHLNIALMVYFSLSGLILGAYCIYKTVTSKSILSALFIIPLILWSAGWAFVGLKLYKSKDADIQMLEENQAIDKALAAAKEANQEIHITELKSSEDLAQFVAAHQLAIIKCSAEWCPPCKMMKPIFEHAALQHGDAIAFGEADSEAAAAVHDALGVQGVPTFICYKHGTEAFRFVGYKPAEAFEAELQKLLAQ